MGMWVSIGYTLLTAPLFFNAETILLALGQKPAVAALAANYVMIVQFGLLPALLFAVLRSLVSAIGRAGIILYVTVAVLLMNAVYHSLAPFRPAAARHDRRDIVAVIVRRRACSWSPISRRPETRRYELFVRFGGRTGTRCGGIRLPISVTVLAEVSLFTPPR